MDTNEALDIIRKGRLLIEGWVDQVAQLDAVDGTIKDRDITRCLRQMTEAALHAPHYEALAVAQIVELTEARLNLAR